MGRFPLQDSILSCRASAFQSTPHKPPVFDFFEEEIERNPDNPDHDHARDHDIDLAEIVDRKSVV
jgi:hypothetical protein